MAGFCSDLAMDEPLAGSAAHAGQMLLIRWPRKRWTRDHGAAPDMPQALQDKLAEIVEGGRRVNLIDRSDAPAGICRLILIPEYRAIDVAEAEVLETLLTWEMGNFDGWRAQPVPLFLTCTHSQRERCCALHGEATFRALDAAQPPGEVWRSSHLGGCRFSATVLSLPAGRKYGRMRAASIPDFLAAEAEDRPYLPAYRGRIDQSEAAQVTHIAALQWAAETGATLGEPQETATGWTVPAETPDGPVTLHISLEKQDFDSPDACRKLDAGATSPRTRLTAHLTRIAPQYPSQ
ncbi:sucrase ferredoxin [Paracoccaceae bacterium GXU_MW_L88]